MTNGKRPIEEEPGYKTLTPKQQESVSKAYREMQIEEIREPERLEEIQPEPKRINFRKPSPPQAMPVPVRERIGGVLRKGLSTASAMAHKMAEPPPKQAKQAIRKAYIVKAPTGRRTKRRSRRELVYIEEPVIHEEFKSPSQTMMDKIAGSSGPAQESHLDRLFGSGSSGGGEHPTDTYMKRLMGNGGKKKGKGGTGGLPYKL